MKPLLVAPVYAALTWFLSRAEPAHAAADGQSLYTQYCAMCHQAGGQGIPAIFPPLAKSDFLKQQRIKAIQAPCEGLSGKIVVNGLEYNSAMPMVVLDDVKLAAVMTYIFTSWGNAEAPVDEKEVAQARAGTKFPTFVKLQAANGFSPLPTAPEGWELAEAGQLQFSPARMAYRPGDSMVLLLTGDGHVWNFSPSTGQAAHLLAPSDYLDPKQGTPASYGIGWDREHHFYITSNQRQEFVIPNVNLATVWRTTPILPGSPLTSLPKPTAWFQTKYNWGIGGFNHGISHIAQGPDGFLYVTSGSRTDGGELGNDERYSKEGETPVTACLWKLDPKLEHPILETFAHGMRNAFGFAWTSAGEHYAVVNGPDADMPEELDHLKPGKHYGFPYQFGDSTAKAYPYTPEAPVGLTFTYPVLNQGPDGLDYQKKIPTATFTPHSSPAGIIWLEDEIYPSAYRHSFFTVRFGNLLTRDQDSGFDLLQIKLNPATESGETATIKTILHPLARPIDLIEYRPGHLLIAEYSRGITYAAGLGQPGRILSFRLKSRP